MPKQDLEAPTRYECLQLLADAGAPAQLIEHTIAVAAAAVELARRCGQDVGLCEAAALLHDIGKAPRAHRMLAALRSGTPCARNEPDDDEAGNPYARLGHDELGARLLQALGGRYALLAGIVDCHGIAAVLRASPGRRPTTDTAKVVFLADKMIGGAWLGFRGRIADLLERYGHRFDVRLCVPGCEVIRQDLAHIAALSADDLEAMVATAVAAQAGASCAG